MVVVGVVRVSVVGLWVVVVVVVVGGVVGWVVGL